MSSAPGAPPQIIRRNDVGPTTTSATAPGIPEASSNLSEGASRLSSVPSHDNSSHSGSEKGGVIERVNPFETPMMSSNAAAAPARGPVEQIGSHHSASPERTNAAPPNPPSSPAHITNVTSMPRSPPPMPMDIHATTLPPGGGPQMPVGAEEDDITHSSSAVNSTEPASSYTPSTESHPPPSSSASAGAAGMAGSFVRFIESTRKRMNTATQQQRTGSEDDLIEDLDGMIISGYLQKLGRNGKWQTRWFESDGECLSYYKNENRTKLLATLDLEKVGTIGLDPADDNECSFTIQVLGRLYHLRAENKVSCTDWVITLNRIKEARMHQGNVKLVGYQQQQPSPVDLLDHPENLVAPRVVVVSNRHRTRAVAETQDFDQLYRENGAVSHELEGMGANSKRLSTIGTVVLARWNKRRSSLSRLRSKLTKWARSLRNLSCASESGAGLDNHVHPPGHDDARKRKHLGWIGKETTAASPDAAVAPEDKQRARKMSSASEEIRVLS